MTTLVITTKSYLILNGNGFRDSKTVHLTQWILLTLNTLGPLGSGSRNASHAPNHRAKMRKDVKR